MKPDLVRKAVWLIYGSLAIGVVRMFFEWGRIQEISAASKLGPNFVYIVGAISTALMLLLVFCIGRRHNWARWTFTAFLVLGAPLAVKPLMDAFAANAIDGVLGVIQTLMQIVAVVFLFQKPSREWFAKRAEPTETPFTK